jgi:hypothetical protein
MDASLINHYEVYSLHYFEVFESPIQLQQATRKAELHGG